jgi:hypothetical protein
MRSLQLHDHQQMQITNPTHNIETAYQKIACLRHASTLLKLKKGFKTQHYIYQAMHQKEKPGR